MIHDMTMPDEQETRRRERHQALHRAFDELLACFLAQHGRHRGGITLLQTPLADFIVWSYQQTLRPQCAQDTAHGMDET
jgi:hypothetical protein